LLKTPQRVGRFRQATLKRGGGQRKQKKRGEKKERVKKGARPGKLTAPMCGQNQKGDSEDCLTEDV